ncbi:MAG: hypothetical protein MZW92_38560 [Comamonadaceae bacterium]|nr:hypothetical protein [Comamonadaceae bacterium]
MVPDDRAEDVGRVMASFKGVSHCYRRPTYPDWPYSVFTMVHGQDAKGCSGRHRRHGESNGHRRICPPVQHQGVQEGPAPVFHAEAG